MIEELITIVLLWPFAILCILALALLLWPFAIICTIALAARRGRSIIAWTVLAMVFGIFALLLLACLPDRHRPRRSLAQLLTPEWRQGRIKTSPNPYLVREEPRLIKERRA